MYDFDLAVIGGGSAGLVAAVLGATLGAKTVLIERAKLGGDCTWRGCVPSKTLLALAAQAASRGSTRDWEYVRKRLDAVREEIYREADSPEVLGRQGVACVFGDAIFTSKHELVIRGSAERTVSSRYITICTGSEPQTVDLGVPYQTSDSIFEMERFPKNLAIVGAGPAGIEMAQAFALLGASVHVIDRGARILAHDEPEHALALTRVLEQQGVQFHFGTTVAAALPDVRRLRLSSGEEVPYDDILVAVGRRPRIDGLQLERAGVRVRNEAVEVNTRCRTSTHSIFAAGDVTGPPYFTHAGEEMSKVAVSNMLVHLPRRYDPSSVPWCTFTHPELAHVGRTEDDLSREGRRYERLSFPNAHVDRAIVDDAKVGGSVLLVQRGRLVGASILAPRAGEIIGELSLAMRAHLPVARIADAIHPYPTYSYGMRRAADDWYVRRLTPFVLALIRIVFRYRGRR